MIFIKPKFRVLEKKMGSGKSKFFPQERKWFVWQNFADKDHLSSQTYTWYLNKDEAERYLARTYKDRVGDKVIKTKTHEFDAVFHALKNE